MNRVPTSPDFIADALQLIALPACACDASGMVVTANGALADMLGMDVAGRLLADCFSDAYRASSTSMLRGALGPGGRERHWDSCLQGVDAHIAVQVWARPLLPADGAGLAGATLVFADISMQQRDQQALRKSLLEQQAILESAAVGILFSRDGVIEECNIRAAEMFGYARHQLTGQPGVALYRSREDYEALGREASPLLSIGRSFSTELELRRFDGSLFWSRLHARAIDPLNTQDGTVWIVEDISDHRRDEDQLRRALVEQQAILDNASVGILFSRSRQVLRCNPRFAEMFGYAQQEMTGMPACELFPSPEAYAEFGAQATPLLGQGLPYARDETQFRRRDGSLFWCRIRAKAVDQGSSEQGTIWILEDVSASRQTQMEVAAIMTNASISILFTKNRLVTRYNLGFAEMFGYQGDEALGMPGRALYSSQDAYEMLGAAAFPFLSVGKPFQTEVEMQRKDGSTLWGQLIAYVVNPQDASAGTIWIIEDRTEAKRAEESLRNALLENQAILDSAVLGISVIEHGYNLHANSKMEELFGYGPGQINGLSVQALYPDLASWKAARRETARDFGAGRVHMSEYQLVRKDGSRFWARLSGRPFDLAHAHGRSVWLVDDVTARREAAEAVLRARDELELRVRERTAELAGANALLQGEIAERRQAEARVHHMAYHDSLTGLPNRALLADRLERAMLASQRSSRKLAVMFIDLDRFKNINDSLGHMTGDILLKEVAARLCRAVRASDTVARLGGDEFVVLVPGIRSAEEAATVAGKIIESLTPAFPLEGHVLHITPSIGICLYPEDGADVDALMRHADAAMYHAKANGRNNYQFFTQKMNQAAAIHFDLESSLRTALAQDQFELYYQPVIDIATRTLHGMEVLLRWRRPGHGLVMPDRFIPILEESGMIVPVGAWVMRKACEQSMAWLVQGLRPVPLAVNLSPRQFMHTGLVAAIRAVLEDSGIAPGLLEFEITETALMQQGEQTLEILRQINAMGLRLSIDDFGTGYSSLAYLKRFPVKKVKIDRAFIKDLETSAEDRAIVSAIIALADSLQLSTVAEGVETEQQFALLQSKGCRYAQGYLFSAPMPASNAQMLLERRASPIES
ncbi:EAL domain-containing protein [Janthinobacterium sp. PC23-8]|uniref:bifunctional diguanylate cyclase/phosphodiesterase n=1 Tax=Janthinobacterium sp. PC23-8 TaxID=2012679 RepID=UPI000B9726BD|nr:EAL domain-containing protein [Janthinobacterium sp. PC23-8]OYO26735.1 GGDEF domain-containing protein [Janthinobacterium sp. PC23-8]